MIHNEKFPKKIILDCNEHNFVFVFVEGQRKIIIVDEK